MSPVTPMSFLSAIHRCEGITPKDLAEFLDFPMHRTMSTLRVLGFNQLINFVPKDGVTQHLAPAYADEPTALKAAADAGIRIQDSISRW